MNQAYEVNFDGLVGPTHNYSGLSYGNTASLHNQNLPSNPRAAALQGLEKMKMLHDLGIKQGVFPPHERPHLPTLRVLGFTESEDRLGEAVFKTSPEIFFNCFSAAAMWTANAATVSPSVDSSDKHVHFTPANLCSKFHRSFEHHTTQKILKTIFSNPIYFIHHDALPSNSYFSDEGAANHTRFCNGYGNPGIQLFVYGKSSFHPTIIQPLKFPARQADEASYAIARLHKLYPKHTVFAQQSPEAIDAGVFHNDVISVGNQHLFFYHEDAFFRTEEVIQDLQKKVRDICLQDLFLIKVPKKRISLAQAVKSYLFNSQIVTLEDQTMTILAPQECQMTPEVELFLRELSQEPQNPINSIRYLDLNQSMQNGGGPACLRLRIVLTEQELAETHPHVLFTETLYQNLSKWIQKHYRDRLTPHELVDPTLIQETRQALDELTQILQLGSIYSFQQN
ncbi:MULTISPECIES: N-succinylarginine dihydrolase [Parachlamydia]|jgi:succinylarginine dihydrolase|uniref:N-succinylarginine dihydrolase n=1 Tax=Parachlamydia acanthamoebae (strain UV7) TaxID=765952 RepID=F8KZ34_PARAV|nr:N-succinylarginine dihydrolase [Parachlamydia acanthamoebae]CCB86157.1 N-succinylarginine dihydrolase [Parachlamydia acanthamoebae UV-7]